MTRLHTGSVLCYRTRCQMEERPDTFAPRTLSSVERNYAQVEKEALVCVIAVEKFHLYISSQSFTLLTDHKPLVTLFGENKPISPQASARLQRLALTLAIYNYRIAFKAVHSEWLASCSGTPVETLLVTSIRTDSARWMHCLGVSGARPNSWETACVTRTPGFIWTLLARC